jgi:predicted ArsR family transcriptional regulator
MNSDRIRLPILEDVRIPLERNAFLRNLLGELAGTLEEVAGLDEASGVLSVAGQRIGDAIHSQYRQALGVKRMTREQVAEVLVDLQRRIEGDFYIIAQDDTQIVLGNRACPFGEHVRGHPSLCMTTSNLFGPVVAENLGYAQVVIEKAIATGADQCRIIIRLQPPQPEQEAEGREYFQG